METKISDLSENNITNRPELLSEFIGQPHIMPNLQVYIKGASDRSEAMDHTLFHGPPGLGKTTLARIISSELGVNLKSISAPASKAGGLVSFGFAEPKDVLFIDEIHRLPLVVEELLYGAMEDNKISVVVSSDHAMPEPIEIDINPFTLVAATTRKGALSQPLTDRFGIQFRLEYYSDEDLTVVVERYANKIGLLMCKGSSRAVAKRSRGTPRIAIRTLRRVRDHAEKASLTEGETETILDKLGMSRDGLDELDQLYLETLKTKFHGGPVGISTLCSALSEAKDTIELNVEPFLIRKGCVMKTPRGRQLVVADNETQRDLFEIHGGSN